MIRGHHDPRVGLIRRPVIDGMFAFPSLGISRFQVRFLVDSGADRTTLSPRDAIRLARRFDIDLTTLAQELPSQGVGGQALTRAVDAELTIASFAFRFRLTILEPNPGQEKRISWQYSNSIVIRSISARITRIW